MRDATDVRSTVRTMLRRSLHRKIAMRTSLFVCAHLPQSAISQEAMGDCRELDLSLFSEFGYVWRRKREGGRGGKTRESMSCKI